MHKSLRTLPTCSKCPVIIAFIIIAFIQKDGVEMRRGPESSEMPARLGFPSPR